MKIEKSDEIIYPAFFKEVNSPLTVIASNSKSGMVIKGNIYYKTGHYSSGWNSFTRKSDWQHIANIVPDIVYPAVFEDEDKQQLLFFNEGSGFSYPDGEWLADEHTNMKHLYNVKIERAD